MTWRVDEVLLIGGCVYEVAALTVLRGRVPTISHIVGSAYDDPRVRVLAWAWLGYVAEHFLVSSRPVRQLV